jgi:hypothetical protein
VTVSSTDTGTSEKNFPVGEWTFLHFYICKTN